MVRTTGAREATVAHHEPTLISPEGDRVPAAAPHHNEGKTVAGWALAWGLMIGAALLGAGLITHLLGLQIAGGIVLVLTVIVGGALRAAGLGQPQLPRREH